MNNKSKLVRGIGVNDYEGKVTINGKNIKSYAVWNNMLMRCYSEEYQERNSTYIGCSVAEEWLSFNCFKKWFYTNYRWDLVELGIKVDLDKDLIIEGNKIYSPDTCVFLPSSVNTFLTNKQKSNTSGATGVSWNKSANKWMARITDSHRNRKHLGYFTNIEDAKQAYELARQQRCLEVQEQMRDLGYSENIVKLIK